MLAPGETFQTDPFLSLRERWDPAGFRVFVTERGIQKLAALSDQGLDRRLAAWFVVLGALVGSGLTYFIK